MPLLPEELRGTQEQARAHLPAHDVGPLVAEDRQVTVGLDPVLVGVPDDRLGGRTHDELLLEFRIGIDDDPLALGIVLQAIVRHHGALLGEALDVVGLLREERLGNEEREIGVLMSRLLEHPIQRIVHLLPDGIAVGFDDHAPADGRIFRQSGLDHQIVVPLRVVLVGFGEVFEFLSHNLSWFYVCSGAQIYKKIKVCLSWSRPLCGIFPRCGRRATVRRRRIVSRAARSGPADQKRKPSVRAM